MQNKKQKLWKRALSFLLMLTLILHNLLDQHSHNALRQSLSYWHKSTNYKSNVTYKKLTKLGNQRPPEGGGKVTQKIIGKKKNI